MTSTRRNISQPPDWWAAFARQAEASGLSLSEWIGNCCRARLQERIRRTLSYRPQGGRPKKSTTQEER